MQETTQQPKKATRQQIRHITKKLNKQAKKLGITITLKDMMK